MSASIDAIMEARRLGYGENPLQHGIGADPDEPAGPGWIWMRIAPGQYLDNLSRDLHPGETVLLRLVEAARLEAAGVVVPCAIATTAAVPVQGRCT